MRIALVNNERSEPKPGMEGLCPGCSQPVIAKCGEQRIHHWAHRANKLCHNWREHETEWHRSWKNNFPLEWQEIISHDEQTGEKHISDICTNHGLVIEFQHSRIKSEERVSREKFYKNMMWVVDGTRLKSDYPRFVKRKNHFVLIDKGVFLATFPEQCFPCDWLECDVPVVFDFHGLAVPREQQTLWCLLSGRDDEGGAVVVEIQHTHFLYMIRNSLRFFTCNDTLAQIQQRKLKEEQIKEEQRKIRQRDINRYKRNWRL